MFGLIEKFLSMRVLGIAMVCDGSLSLSLSLYAMDTYALLFRHGLLQSPLKGLKSKIHIILGFI